MGPIDHMPKEVHIMPLCLSSNLFVVVCLDNIFVFVAPCHVALGEVSVFEIVWDIFMSHNE